MSTDVPVALRRWFVVHFVADITFAIPLLLAPRQLGELLGHSAVDPLTARMVAAALVGIGVESFLGRNDSRATFLTMLRLKVLWAGTAIAGAIAVPENNPAHVKQKEKRLHLLGNLVLEKVQLPIY